MCGINGIFKSGGIIDPQSSITAMNNTLVHRGPDAQGTYFGEQCALGHTRLSIIDLNERSNQPMWSACGRYVMVYNGEVYNYGEIAAKLYQDHGAGSGFKLKTSGDSEVVLEAFVSYGTGFVEYLNGMFAIAIFDTLKQELYVFRDRLGIKPLFYIWKDDTLAFASELKALMALNLSDGELDPVSVSEFLQLGFVPAPRTIYKDISKLPGGSYLKVSGKNLEVSKYWDVNDKIIATPYSDMNQVIVNLSDMLISSVQYQLRSDVPFGVFLSGGVDSSLITAQAVMMSSTKINTFSIGFKENKYNESEYARAVAEYLETEHHEFIVTYQEALGLIEQIIDVYDEPYADSSAIPTMLVSKLARSKVTVTLSGEGGDELFMGYGSYQWARRLANPMASLIRHPVSRVFSHMDSRFKRISKMLDYGKDDNLMKHIFGQEQYLFSNKEVQKLIHPELKVNGDASAAKELRELSYSFYEDGFKNGTVSRKLDRMEMQALFDLQVYLQDDLLTKVDRASMKYSLEARVPYLDHRIVEYAVNISPALKCHGGIPKYILKEILYQYLPQKIFDRPKQGFAIPLAKWLKSDLRYLITNYLSDDAIEKTAIFDPLEVKQLISRFDSGDDYLYNRLWLLIVLQMWRLKRI